jgi:2-oxoglutarate dehydrogenase E1 component
MLYREAQSTSYLAGANASFIEALYECYLEDPAAVEPHWRGYFDELQKPDGSARDIAHGPVRARFATLAMQTRATGIPAASALPAATPVQVAAKQYGVWQLISAYRSLGVRHANLDPLNRQEKPYIPELEIGFYGLGDADMQTEFDSGTLVGPRRMKLADILQLLNDTYCRTLGVEYTYIADMPIRRWMRERLESIRSTPNYDTSFKKYILERLTAAETLERYLHTRYVGQTRFSLEGGDSLIPMLDHLLQCAGAASVQESVIGMAHRGRLNVLVNTLGKLPKDLFSDFEDKHESATLAGDVKYHDGFSSDVATPGGPLHISLAFNPSHLEIVNPVVEGSVRARQHRRRDKTGDQVLPVLIHGDASYSGQGVVMETLNLAQTRGFGTGGTVHIVINNQIGFTTSDPRDTRSTIYCTDVSKMLGVPIFHVNGDDPEMVCLVTEIALAFRMHFHKDVVIDLVCYRRLGHNEQDEPMVTQPLMYKKIRALPTARLIAISSKVAARLIVP